MHTGRHLYRMSDNPMEARFAQAWREANEHPKSILGYLLGDGNRPAPITPEQAETAATVIQWLGSPVGQGFLRDVGFVPKDSKQ